MQLKDMQYVITIADTRSFSKAAEQLYVSQPALSHAVRRLEEEFGTLLFIRELNNVRPTDAGLVFIDQARRILAMTDTLGETMSLLRKKAPLHLGISSFYSKYYLPKILPAFKSICPEVSLEITEDLSRNMEIMTRENRLDLCMVPFPLAYPSLASHVVKEEQILLAVPENHPYAAKHDPDVPVNLLDLADEKWIFLHKSQRFTSMAMQICEAAGFHPDIILETMNWDTVYHMIRSGEGVGFIPDILASHDSIRCFPLTHYGGHRSYAVVYPADSPRIREIRCFLDSCSMVFGTPE